MEEWRKTVRNPNYIVSNTGRVRRINAKKDHSTREKKGYLVTDLYENGERSTERVHILVAEAFIPNPESKPEVNHEDGNKHNNAVSNLSWATKKENCEHAWRTGLARPSYGMLGKSNPNGGRKGKPFRIVETGETFNTLKECAELTGLNPAHVNECLNGRHITHGGYHYEYL